MKKYQANTITKFFWIIPFIVGVSKNKNNNKRNVYGLHLTPFIEISFGLRGTRGGFNPIVEKVSGGQS